MRNQNKRILFKLTDENMRTRNDFQWKLGKTYKTSGKGELCKNGFLHFYINPLLAVLLNPIHANFKNPRLFRAVGNIVRTDNDLKIGSTRVKLVKELKLPVVSLTQRVAFGILCSLEVYKEESFKTWAFNWLNDVDRSCDTATAVANAAYAAAAYAATYAAAYAAANAARAAANAATCADAAARVDAYAAYAAVATAADADAYAAYDTANAACDAAANAARAARARAAAHAADADAYAAYAAVANAACDAAANAARAARARAAAHAADADAYAAYAAAARAANAATCADAYATAKKLNLIKLAKKALCY